MMKKKSFTSIRPGVTPFQLVPVHIRTLFEKFHESKILVLQVNY